jgi:hypothetical protein
MSAYLDSFSGAGYDGSDDGGIGAYGIVAPQTDGASVMDGVGANYFSGALQTLTSLGTGYLSKRLDVDLQSRIYGSQPLPRIGTTQNPIPGYGTVVRNPQGQQVAQLNLSALMPIVLVGLGAYFIAKRA